MRHSGRTVEQECAAQAAGRHGVVARRQLLAAGVTPSEIRHRLGCGALIPRYKGVYRVGHVAPSFQADYLAAVMACGDGAVLCGPAAGYLLRLLRVQRAPMPEVLTPTERRLRGVITHRARGGLGVPDPVDLTIWSQIPVTNPARTLVDLAAVLSRDALARACHEAGVRYRITPAMVESVLARRPTGRGAAELRRVIHGDTHVTLSALERGFLALLRKYGFPLPVTNRRASGRRVDCRWPDLALTIELDGYRYHHSRHAWEVDRRREREARTRGDEFRRFTYGDVMENPSYMLSELRVLLGPDSPG